MSLAKIASGDGYEYYVRNIATHDANDRGEQALADYYSERGESPGRWWGSGLADLTVFDTGGEEILDAIFEGEEVTESQMWALFGRGLHPNAEKLIADEVAAKRAEGFTARTARAHAIKVKARIGMPFIKPSVDEFSYRAEKRRAYEAWNAERGRDAHAPIPETDREYIATEVAQRMFVAEHGHEHRNEEELSSWVAKALRPSSKRIAGFDLTFSPVKSVSALWALAPRPVAETIEAAHLASIVDALGFLELNATYTRIGAGGVAQVEVGGLIATMFDHRDSRAGDPDLHTHVVISNKVHRKTGEWGALDGRMIYQHAVTASEIYNTRLEHHLETMLGGIRFVERDGLDADKRPIRELAGFDERLAVEWSTRDVEIQARKDVMIADFQARHGREPSPKELHRMDEEATLSTRGGKHHARTRDEQRTDWMMQARRVLKSAAAVNGMVRAMLSQEPPRREPVEAEDIAAEVVETVSRERATWQIHHISAEAVRKVRGRIDPNAWDDMFPDTVAYALGEGLSIRRDDEPMPRVPGLTRSDGVSIYTRAHSTKYTSHAIVAAEQRLLAAARLDGGRAIPAAAIEVAEVEYAANGHTLNPGQRALVLACATSGRRFMAAVAPAGTGKTTAMRVLVDAWTAQGGNAFGIAPTASAAATFARESGVPAATVDMLLTLAEHSPERLPDIDERTLVIIDEAAKVSTRTLDAAITFLTERGATVRAIGDDRQLSSVAAGGIVRDIVETTEAPTLTKVMRFADPGEAAASLALRGGDPAGLAYYFDHHRVRVGTLTENVAAAFRAWRADHARGHDAAMLAPTRALVSELNALARTERLARAERHGEILGPETLLADGHSASVGDVIATRLNNRKLRISDTDYVRNGYRWEVRTVHADGAITAAHIGSRRRVTLPADYVRAHVGLGYATTIDSAQGITVDRCHGVLTGRESRAQLYVMLTRGRTGNHLYLGTATAVYEHTAHTYEAIHPPTALDLLTGVLAREGTQVSATTSERAAEDPHLLLADAVESYEHAVTHLAETRVGAARLAEYATRAESLVPDITDAEAWPVLRAHLALLDLAGHDPLATLTAAVAVRELDTAADPAAVLDWRIDATGRHSQRGHPPLPWLPAIPAGLPDTEHQHLLARAAQIRAMATTIADHTRTADGDRVPLWARGIHGADPALTGGLAIWRAAHRVPDLDRRPTGPARYPLAQRREQQRLDRAVADRVGNRDAYTRRWRPLIDTVDARIAADPYWPTLAREFSRAADTTGLDIPAAVRAAHDERQLPAEQPAAALRWRMTETLDTPTPEPPRELPGAVLQLDTAPTTPAPEPPTPPVTARDQEREAALARARERLRGTRPDDLRRMSDAQLAQITTHRPFHSHTDGGVGVVTALSVRRAEQDLDAVRERHQRLDRDAAAIRRARPAITALDALRATYRDQADEITQARHELDTTHRIRWRARAERQDHIDALEHAHQQTRRELDAARAEADRLRLDAPPPVGSSWEKILADADDQQGRDTEITAATNALAAARASQIDNAVRAAIDDPFLRAARAEIQRRDQLTDLDRAAEDYARAEADNQPAAAGAGQRRDARVRRAVTKARRRPTLGTGFDSGPHPGPGLGGGPSHGSGHGYGL
ncbi:MobF family relaxase [Nocardia bovistercoris]|uniref:Relaxase domain-containing protein n=1 Tax=Nocardia bovistercoris TaxID=2785916 RepID=A0A931IHZ4_9NOCA|nr:MobF family relaxase [Nocardia bovistercoris]MBH0780362.1 relaxase domain-containing protein [Nocardia bovistercoris]